VSLYLQYGIVGVVVAGAAWTAWRILRGQRVFGRGSRPGDAGGCANCSAADHHKKH
jgi:hypothetical protein